MKHKDLTEWSDAHGSELTIGTEVLIREASNAYIDEYDRGMKFKVVLLYVDIGGVNIGLSDATLIGMEMGDKHICEIDGYRVSDLRLCVEAIYKVRANE
ncbi:MAG: hypothetical protein HRT93_03265 [Piscirickettsiaceae bacterium]|nr:hypothetical protein [Piscirickettsiaceae bacterium]